MDPYQYQFDWQDLTTEHFWYYDGSYINVSFLRDQWTDPVYLKFFNRNALIMSLNLLHKNQMIESNDLPWSQCAGTAVLGRHNWIKDCKIPKSSVNVLLPGTEQLGPSINALLIINVAKKCKNS